MELEDLKGLIDLLKDTDVSEIEIERDGVTVKLKRGMNMVQYEPAHIQPRKLHALPQRQPAVAGEAESEESQRLLTVTSPLVGTFYRSSSPEAAPFVEVGQRVEKGKVLCIVEAMKLMNEIESEVDGIVVKALVENGHAVEYGEPLFLIDVEA